MTDYTVSRLSVDLRAVAIAVDSRSVALQLTMMSWMYSETKSGFRASWRSYDYRWGVKTTRYNEKTDEYNKSQKSAIQSGNNKAPFNVADMHHDLDSRRNGRKTTNLYVVYPLGALRSGQSVAGRLGGVHLRKSVCVEAWPEHIWGQYGRNRSIV